MAHNVIGLDLGSHCVKAIVAKMTFRGAEIIKIEKEMVPLNESGKSSNEDILSAAGRLVKRLASPGCTINCAIWGEQASIRKLSIPISASRRLEQVLAFELDDVLPFDIDNSVFDYFEVERVDQEIKILATAVPVDRVSQILDGLKEKGVDPREIDVAPLVYEHLAGSKKDDDVVAFIDMGHIRTNISVVDGRVSTARTVLRGGRDLSAKIAEVGKISFDEAEAIKKQHGMSGRVGEVITEALKPLLREARQTIKGHLAAGGRRVNKVFICGGSSALDGLATHMSNELGIMVTEYDSELAPKGLTNEYVLAHALTLRETMSSAKRTNVRRGILSFKGDYEFLRRRIGWMIACGGLIVLAWAMSVFAEYQGLSKTVEKQHDTVADVTKRIFGESIFDRKEIEKRFAAVEVEKPPIPLKDAFDIVVKLSDLIPEDLVHDIETLDISQGTGRKKRSKVVIKGIVGKTQTDEDEDTDVDAESSPEKISSGGSVSAIDQIRQELESFKECFTKVDEGKTSTTRDGRQKYTMTIDSVCP